MKLRQMHIVPKLISIFSILIIVFDLLVLLIQFWQRESTQDNDNDGNLTTSIVAMEPLLKMEQLLMQNMNDYAETLEQRRATIRSVLRDLREEHEKAEIDAEAYLSIPLNSVALLRRINEDWPRWLSYMQEQLGAAQIHSDKLVTRNDLLEAITALQRIQSTYDLRASDLAAGLINGKQYNAKFTALDCFSIGKALYDAADSAAAAHWLNAALQRFEEHSTNDIMNVTHSKILDLLGSALLQPKREQNVSADDFTYNMGCRGKFAPTVSTRLHCIYNSTTTPFLRLAPLKMEIIKLDPYVVLFHDVLSDREIAAVKAIARGGLKRAKVISESRLRNIFSNGRTSKVAWVRRNESEITQRIYQRVTDMTGFNASAGESLQVLNYGVGGHYTPHRDFIYQNKEPDEQGDRIATVLFYMTDVDQGGGTTFPKLNLTIVAKKGTALLWYNLDNRGECNERTLHGACPVVVGSKWVFTKWIRLYDQMFLKPCYKD